MYIAASPQLTFLGLELSVHKMRPFLRHAVRESGAVISVEDGRDNCSRRAGRLAYVQ